MISNLRFLAAALILGAIVASAQSAFAMGGGPPSVSEERVVDRDYVRAEKAITEHKWDEAVELLEKARSRDDNNPDIHNYLGFAERQRGNLEAAFKHYDRAIALNPKHRGAREYAGEAYLMADNLPKAEEQLAVLDKLCTFSCEEYRELKQKIAQYKEKHK